MSSIKRLTLIWPLDWWSNWEQREALNEDNQVYVVHNKVNCFGNRYEISKVSHCVVSTYCCSNETRNPLMMCLKNVSFYLWLCQVKVTVRFCIIIRWVRCILFLIWFVTKWRKSCNHSLMSWESSFSSYRRIGADLITANNLLCTPSHPYMRILPG